MEPVCPECKNGKHQNCDSVALDVENDVLVRCACDVANHGITSTNIFDASPPVVPEA